MSAGARLPSASFTSSVARSEEHTSELQSLTNLVCRLLLEKKKKKNKFKIKFNTLTPNLGLTTHVLNTQMRTLKQACRSKGAPNVGGRQSTSVRQFFSRGR